MDKVLLVEDDFEFQDAARNALAGACALTVVASIQEAQLAMETEAYSLLLLDIGLPDGNGMIFCKRLRENPKYQDLPIVFISSMADVHMRIQGLALGADDYVVKPFDPGELRARVEIRLRRKPKTVTTFEMGIFHVDLLAQRIQMKNFEGMKIPLQLTPIEFKMLVLFLRNEKKLFTRDELLQALWGDVTHVSMHAIETHASTLRKKIGDAGRFLRVIPRKGYYFTFEEGPEKLRDS